MQNLLPTALDWSWLWPVLAGVLLPIPIIIGGYFVKGWWQRRGTTVIHIGDRRSCEYITRGRWDTGGKEIIQSAPRFMNFVIPLTFENQRATELTVHVKNIWFSHGKPEIGKKREWALPGSSLHPTGFRIENSAGEIFDPIRVPPYGIVHAKITGTATSQVCHPGPYQSWRYVFIDWISLPVDLGPFIQVVPWTGSGRSLAENIEPLFPLPPHYPKMQGG